MRRSMLCVVLKGRGSWSLKRPQVSWRFGGHAGVAEFYLTEAWTVLVGHSLNKQCVTVRAI